MENLKDNIKSFNLFEKNNYEELEKKLIDNKIIDIFKNFLNEIFKGIKSSINFDNKKTREFLIIFMISYNSETIFNEIDAIEIELINISNETIELLKNIVVNNNDNYTKFYLKTKLFLSKFKIWKNKDKKKLLTILYNTYKNLKEDICKIKDNKEYEDILNEYSKQKKDIEVSVRSVIGEEGLLNFIEGKFTDEESNNQKIKDELIIGNLKKAYWDIIEEQLKIDYEDFTFVIKLLDEIKQLLKNMVPSRYDLHKKWDIQNKVEILKQINSKKDKLNISIIYLKNYANILLDLESPERNNITKDIIKSIDSKIENFNDNVNKNNFNKLILKNIQDLYEQIFFVIKDLNNIKKK